MATVTSVVHAFMVALVDKLELRPGFEDVQVASAWLGGDAAAEESIQLDGARAEQAWGALGNKRRDEEFTVDGLIWVVVAGKDEAIIRECRARAFELLAELEDCLRVDPGVDGTVKVCGVASYELEQGANTDGRWCQLNFEIRCEKDLRSS